MYLFNEMHTDSEQIAVPHPPQCAHWGTFPPGEGIAVPHLNKFQFIGLLWETAKHIPFYGFAGILDSWQLSLNEKSP